MSNDKNRASAKLEGIGSITRKTFTNEQLFGKGGDPFLYGADVIGEYDHLDTITPVSANNNVKPFVR